MRKRFLYDDSILNERLTRISRLAHVAINRGIESEWIRGNELSKYLYRERERERERERVRKNKKETQRVPPYFSIEVA